ncbi:MAG: right-handed parallel beta-helix repeat-containing protein [Caulobacterales bacterium]|nr:right-handed parallel beta-helix repeat-containing protein [Caulobacterales bacterium]
MRLFAAAAVAAFVMVGAADARTWRIRPGPEAEQALQTALIEAEPGDTVQLGRGRIELSGGLSLDVDRVTIRGDGEQRSILSFNNQRRGAEGLLITSDGVTLRGFAVENARGDAIKARDCNGITIRDVRVEWTGGPSPNNGAYGLYPVNCDNVLIERSIARGASDAGIYVGQSRNIIVRDNIAEFNVAGIEIENSFNADVFGNTATRNTGGVLVFDLPGLPQTGGHSVRVFENRIFNNDTPNFAPAGNIVASVPTGTGVLIMANRNVHVFDNEIGDNGTVNVLITAYRESFEDRTYNPLARDVVIRDNRFGNTGFAPAGDLAALTQLGVPIPDVLWDGATLYSVGGAPRTENVRIVVRDNRSTRTGGGSFLSLGMPAAGSPLTEAAPDPTPPPLLEIAEPEEVRIRN